MNIKVLFRPNDCHTVRISKENLSTYQKGGVTDTYHSHVCEYVSMTHKIAIKMLLNFSISSIELMLIFVVYQYFRLPS